MSAADILTELYFEQMDINKENVNTIDRDRFVLKEQGTCKSIIVCNFS